MKGFLSLVAIVLLTVFGASAKDRVSPHDTIHHGSIRITYGRPSKKDRNIFGGLVPYGKVWRTGADEATEIRFEQSCEFAGKHVPKGTYTLFTIPTDDEWTVILNKETGQFGAFDYEKVQSKNIVEAKIAPKTSKHVVEQFTITIEEQDIKLEWDKTVLAIPVSFNGSAKTPEKDKGKEKSKLKSLLKR